MNHNDVLRRVRFALRIDDKVAISIFQLVGYKMDIEYLKANMKKEEEPGFLPCRDGVMAMFLDGLIIKMRGEQPGGPPPPLARGEFLSNNDILRKLRIALSFRDDDMLEVMKLGNFNMSKGEMSAFFRKPDHRNFKPCGDQVLRYFLLGLARKLRPDVATPTEENQPKVNSPAIKKALKKNAKPKRAPAAEAKNSKPEKPADSPAAKKPVKAPYRGPEKRTGRKQSRD
ncbi:MAG: DUF1456 family protein [Alteromonadaceae bacterium]|nr:DUF1456 family protein [Alteromonadaceae bacterium]